MFDCGLSIGDALSMITELNIEQEKWVDSTLRSMTIEECIAQMLKPHHPFDVPQTHFESVANATTDFFYDPLIANCIMRIRSYLQNK